MSTSSLARRSRSIWRAGPISVNSISGSGAEANSAKSSPVSIKSDAASSSASASSWNRLGNTTAPAPASASCSNESSCPVSGLHDAMIGARRSKPRYDVVRSAMTQLSFGPDSASLAASPWSAGNARWTPASWL
ncbi:hypothetical protein SDC9_164100 [bioreactor metagenome]|uniref:Uncharacterized protein n=1 Tax=bioreactor metagenome TaxID=1076179 RepID=A0A645FQP8_9ZZZZ